MDFTRVLSIGLEPPDVASKQVETNLEAVLDALSEVDGQALDFVCFPEFVLHLNVADRDKAAEAQSVPGPATDAVSAQAEAMGSHVLLPMLRREGDRVYNSVVLIDPDGDVRGWYDKIRPTPSGLDRGTTPGSDPVVWDTEHGRVSAVICFDIKFPEVAASLGAKKPKLVFFPSMFPGGHRLRAWAMEYGFYMVLASPTETAIVSPLGAVLSRNRDSPSIGPIRESSGDGTRRYSMHEINLDFNQYHRSMGGTNARKFEEVRDQYGDSVVFHHSRPEGIVLIESRDEDVSIEEIERDVGLVDMQDYLDRARAACRRRVSESSDVTPLASRDGQE